MQHTFNTFMYIQCTYFVLQQVRFAIHFKCFIFCTSIAAVSKIIVYLLSWKLNPNHKITWDNLNYVLETIIWTISKFIILLQKHSFSGVEVRLQKYFGKSHCRQDISFMVSFYQGSVSFILSIRKAKEDRNQDKKKIVHRDLSDNISLKWLVFGLRTNGIFMLHDLRNFVFV